MEVVAEDPIVLRVTDAGPGIADVVADRIFHERIAASRQGVPAGAWRSRTWAILTLPSLPPDEVTTALP